MVIHYNGRLLLCLEFGAGGTVSSGWSKTATSYDDTVTQWLTMSITYFDRFGDHRLFGVGRLSWYIHLLLFISLDFLAVLLLFLWSEGGGDFAVESGEVRF